jgi:hypothetical protein
VKPFITARRSRLTPTSQLISRGRRKAPVKKTRQTWVTREATKTRAAQWWSWRITSPARTSKLSRTAER